MKAIHSCRRLGALLAAFMLLTGTVAKAAEVPVPRPVARYDFTQDVRDGGVSDSAAVYPDMDLVIRGATIPAVRVADGTLTLLPPSQVESPGLFSRVPVTHLIGAIAGSGSFSIEVWARAANIDQRGPARIVSISRDTATRNVTLGQDGDHLVLRLRTTATDDQGMPELRSPQGTVDPERFQHIVATFDGTQVVLYVDGVRVAESDESSGTLANWAHDMPLVLGNEATGDRPWHGRIRLVALYAYALYDEEVAAAHAAGSPGR